MKSQKKLAILLAIVLAAASFSLAGCATDPSESPSEGSSESTPATGADAKTIVYGSGDYTSINPALYEHGEINSLLFAGLTARDAENNVIPGLAEEWTFDEETLTYTFKLRDGITFHDGEKLTSEDVKFTLETIMNEDYGSEIMSNYEEIEEITTDGDLTVNIKLDRPNVAMPDYLTVGILPKHLLDGENVAEAAFNQNPIGAGPYKLTEWDMGQSISMEKFDDYYLGAPKLDKIIFKIVEAYDARALQLKSGELTLAQVTPKDSEEFKSDDRFTTYVMDTADYRGIMYNFNNPFWQKHRELPAALSYAVDRQAMIDSVLLGMGQIAYSPLQKGAFANDGIEKYDYSPENAKAAIEAAGWILGSNGYYEKDGEELAFEISVRPSDPVRVDMANIAAQNFQDIGVNAVVVPNAKTDWANQYTFLIGWGSPFDPDDHTYKVFGTDKGANYSSYSNVKVDELLEQGRSFEEASERMPYYQDFQVELAKDPAYTFFAYIDAVYIADKALTGISSETTLGHHGVGIFFNVHEWDLN